jgi:hypothetical protein
MTIKQTAATGGAVALLVSGAVLTLLYYGLAWDIMQIGHTDLRVILWPSSVMLTIGWCSTAPGIMTTISSVAINCLLYMGIALLLRSGLQWLLKSNSNS